MSLKEFLEACAGRAAAAMDIALAKTGGAGPDADSLPHQRALCWAKYMILESCIAADAGPAAMQLEASYHREAAWMSSTRRSPRQQETARLILTMRGGGSSGVYVYGWFE